MLRLYDVPLSPFAQKVKMALIEKGIPFERRDAELGIDDPELGAANPRQEVPALLDGEAALFDSTIILQYIEDKWPDPPLLPPTPVARAKARMIEEICDTQLEAINWALIEIQTFGRAEGALADRIVARAERELAQMQSWLARQLGDAAWFNGERFGYADIAAFPFLMGAAFRKLGPDPNTPLARWLDETRQRASAQSVLAEASAALKGPALAFRRQILSGERPRQYRDHRLEFMIRAGGWAVVERGLADGTIRFSTLPG